MRRLFSAGTAGHAGKEPHSTHTQAIFTRLRNHARRGKARRALAAGRAKGADRRAAARLRKVP
ncbi:hypothetical protein SDC9_100149 [bioreactor metagenome]|uniref:Uncharacterized protein n=1 Tax=bioreactor metagenome TaxID=1076179 RepID=A0A645AJI3_9ZZZZ